jgi:hypothetical protein
VSAAVRGSTPVLEKMLNSGFFLGGGVVDK